MREGESARMAAAEAGGDASAAAPWGPWVTVGIGLIVAVLFVGVQGVVGVFFLIGAMARHPGANVMALAHDLGTNGLVLSVATLASFPFCMGAILVAVVLRGGPSVREYLGLRFVRPGRLVLALSATALFMVCGEGLSRLLERPDPEFMARLYRTAGSAPLLWLAVVVVGPVFEEVLVRGFLFEGLRRSRLGGAGAVLLTSVLWILPHVQYGLFELGLVLALGILFGTFRLATGSTIPPIAMHVLVNLAAMVGLALQAATGPPGG